MVRAKFKCDTITTERNAYGEFDKITFRAVSDGSEENKAFWKATPSGTLEMQCVNKEATAQFTPGASYYLDFTPAE